MDTIKRMINGVGSAAMLIAMTKTISDEQDIKQYLTDAGYKYAVTELGGNTVKGDFQGRATKALIGAVLNTHLVEKTSYELHAVLHAAMDAGMGSMLNVSRAADMSVKMAVVRKDHWVAVAIFGESAVYYTTNHERAGLGVMHI